MPDDISPTIPLIERVLARYEELRASDRTIKKLEREAAAEKQILREHRQMLSLAWGSIRNHEAWLKREAATQISKEAGVQTIPGFVGRREKASEYKRRMRRKQEEAQAAAQILIASRGQTA